MLGTLYDDEEAYGTSDDDGLLDATELSAVGRDCGICIVMPSRHWGGKRWLHSY